MPRSLHNSSKGFTLLELIIVIAILSVLAIAVVLLINPAELLKKSRDSQRLSDLKALKTSIELSFSDQAQGSGVDPDGPNFTDACTGEANPKVFVSVPSDNGESSPTDLPSGWTYNRVTAANAGINTGSGWMPVNLASAAGGSPLSNLPLDPDNTFASGRYYSYVCKRNPHFKLTAVLESKDYQKQGYADGGTSGIAFETGTDLTIAAGVFPGGWTRLPSGTLVMQWEAKYDKDGNADGDTASQASCVADSGLGLDWRDVGCSTNTKVVSTQNGAPIVHITHDQAKAACAAIGARLINNTEWMALARDAEQVASNWSSGAVGTGCLFRGNVGADDACGYNGTDPEYGSNRNAKSSLALSNGAAISDIAGNVWEHVLRDASDTLTSQANQPDTALGGAAFNWREFTAITSYGNMTYDMIRPSNSSWDATYGMGRIYTCDTCIDAVNQHVFLRGGTWGNGADAGAFTLSLDWAPSHRSTDVGFRCAR